LSIISFILLLVLLRRANKIAKRTYRCPETGIIVANEDIVCTSFNDRYPSEYTQFSQKKPANFCTNCGQPVTINARFCINCGFKFSLSPIRPIRPKLYDGLTITLFIFTIIAAIIFLIIELMLFVLYLLIYGPAILILLITQTSITLLTIGLMIYAAIRLLMLKRNYDGRKSILYWLILIFNLIGMVVMSFIYGVVGLLYGPMYFMTIGFGILFLIGAVTLFIFLLFVIKSGQQTLQYQRNF